MFVKEEEESDLWDGCRIVELSVLAEGLSACKSCGQPLCWRHTVPKLTQDGHTNVEFLISCEIRPEL